MKAPDKIYLGIQDRGTCYTYDLSLDNNGEQEYIRKDALMELLLSLEARYSVFNLQGKVIRDVIDKIDSL